MIFYETSSHEEKEDDAEAFLNILRFRDGTYENVNLPQVVKVKCKKLDGQRIQITSQNYDFMDIVLKKTINGWTFANILLGGVIGWAVDLGTNAVSKPEQDNFFVNPTPKTKSE